MKWAAASTTGALAVLRYEVRVSLRGTTVKTSTVGGRARSEVIDGLKRHTGYSVSVRAGNWAGWGAWSSSSGARTR